MRYYRNAGIYGAIGLVLIGIVIGSALFFSQGKFGKTKTISKKSLVSVSVPTFRVEGISIDRGGSLAVIEGSVVKEGQEVKGYQVEKIEPSRVLLSKEGLRYWLDDKGQLKSLSSETS